MSVSWLSSPVAFAKKRLLVLLVTLVVGIDVCAATAKSTELNAVISGDVAGLRRILSDPNAAEDGTGRTLLMYAAANGHFDIAKLLVERGARVDDVDRAGRTALMWVADTRLVTPASGKASNPGFRKIVEYLLKQGAKAAQSSGDGLNAFLIAAANGHVDIMQPLLSNGAPLNGHANNGWTALMYAANYGHPPAVRFLLQKRADLSRQDRDGLTALMLATLERRPDIVKLLLDAGANVDTPSKDGVTPLMVTAMLGHDDIAKILLDNKADPDRKAKSGLTALMFAQRDGNMEIATMLRRAGATD